MSNMIKKKAFSSYFYFTVNLVILNNKLLIVTITNHLAINAHSTLTQALQLNILTIYYLKTRQCQTNVVIIKFSTLATFNSIECVYQIPHYPLASSHDFF